MKRADPVHEPSEEAQERKPASKSGCVVPVCVDLDGTLVLGATHWLLMRTVLKKGFFLPLKALAFLLFLGKNQAKHFLANCCGDDWPTDQVIFCESLVVWLKSQQRQGRHLVLVTGAPVSIAQRVCLLLQKKHNLSFQGLFASNPALNCVGKKKAKLLVQEWGKNGFDYVGDSFKDCPVWARARTVYVQGGSAFLRLWVLIRFFRKRKFF